MFFIIIILAVIIICAICIGIERSEKQDYGDPWESEQNTDQDDGIYIGSNRITIFDSDEEVAGKKGEQYAARLIEKEVLSYGDCYFNNVNVIYDGKRCEIDSLIVNEYGVFIIEVKTWNGTLRGEIDGPEWEQQKETDGGSYVNKRGNPIKQVRRQIGILKNYLLSQGINVWIEGYVFFSYHNSPVTDPCVLDSAEQIRRAVHEPTKKPPDRETIRKIIRSLDNYKT